MPNGLLYQRPIPAVIVRIDLSPQAGPEPKETRSATQLVIKWIVDVRRSLVTATSAASSLSLHGTRVTIDRIQMVPVKTVSSEKVDRVKRCSNLE
jgi:hypothetical protein